MSCESRQGSKKIIWQLSLPLFIFSGKQKESPQHTYYLEKKQGYLYYLPAATLHLSSQRSLYAVLSSAVPYCSICVIKKSYSRWNEPEKTGIFLASFSLNQTAVRSNQTEGLAERNWKDDETIGIEGSHSRIGSISTGAGERLFFYKTHSDYNDAKKVMLLLLHPILWITPVH